MRLVLALAVASSIVSGGLAQAQDKVRISVNGGIQVGSQTVGQNFTFTLYQENARVFNDIDVSGGGLFDIGALYHVTGSLWAGVSFSSVSRTTDGTLSAKLPHPFFFNLPRDINGTVSGLDSKETGVHISAAYLLPVSDKLDVAIFGGPSRFSLTQDLVTAIAYSESYPFDTATFTSATTASASASAWGFNVGADVSWRLSKMFAAGGLVRFAKASTTLVADPGNEADIDAGGLMVGGGLRVIF